MTASRSATAEQRNRSSFWHGRQVVEIRQIFGPGAGQLANPRHPLFEQGEGVAVLEADFHAEGAHRCWWSPASVAPADGCLTKVGVFDCCAEDQDIVLDFLLKAAREGINLREVLPKPATAEALLRLAKSK